MIIHEELEAQGGKTSAAGFAPGAVKPSFLTPPRLVVDCLWLGQGS